MLISQRLISYQINNNNNNNNNNNVKTTNLFTILTALV
jgi:hypothetical protein